MEGNELERPELYDFEAGKACLLEAVQKGQAELVTDLLTNGDKNLRLLTMHIFRIAFKNNDLNMVHALIPFGNERDSEVKVSILKEAVKTTNSEIISTVYSGLGISSEILDLKLLKEIQKYLPTINTNLRKEEISTSSFIELLGAGNNSEILAALDQVEEINTAVVEAVMNTNDEEIIFNLAKKISPEGITKEHKALFDWIKENYPDPDLGKQLDDTLSTPDIDKE